MVKTIINGDFMHYNIETSSGDYDFTKKSSIIVSYNDFEDSWTGLAIDGDDNHVFVDGVISEYDQSVAVSGLGNTLEFGSHANIAGGSLTSEHAIQITNRGEVTAGISLSSEDDKVVNYGSITRPVYLGGGNDHFIAHGDGVSVIHGGDGKDRLYTNNSHVALQEEPSGDIDWVTSSVSYKLSENVEILRLIGSKNINGTGSDTDNGITGNSGDNVIEGGGGADNLRGGKGDDDFVFTKQDLRYDITDFEFGHDRIGIVGFANIKHFSDLRDHMVEDPNLGVTITISESIGKSILVWHSHLDQFDRHDFFFG